MSESKPDPDKVKEAVRAMLDALQKIELADDGRVCIMAVGILAGCIAGSFPDPQAALATANKIASGIVDGSLLH